MSGTHIPRRVAGYARRKGVLGDINRIDSRRVSGVTHAGRPFSWKRGPNVELFEFGSFNPANMPGGRLWTAEREGQSTEGGTTG